MGYGISHYLQKMYIYYFQACNGDNCITSIPGDKLHKAVAII